MSKNKEYKGILAKPIQLKFKRRKKPPGLLSAESGKGIDVESLSAGLLGIAERIKALFNHYKVEAGHWDLLALELAKRHVPGFRIVPNQSKIGGAPLFWHPGRLFLVWLDVTNYRTNNPRHSVSSACKNLVNNNPRWRLESKLTLERRYHEAVNSPVVNWFKSLERELGQDAARQYLTSDFLELIENMTIQK